LGVIEIKCPHCNNEGHTDDEGAKMIYGNCKFCGKYFGWEESE